MHANNLFFCPDSKKDNIQIKPFQWLMKINIPHYSCLHAAVCKFRWLQPEAACGDESDSFSLAPPQNCSHVGPVVDPRLQLFSNFCIMTFFKLFCWRLCMRSEPAVNATVEHMEILDAGVQQGLVGENGLKRAQWWRAERKQNKCKKNVRDDGENCAFPGWDDASGDTSGNSAVCGKATVKHAVYVSTESCPPTKTWLISAGHTWLNWKMRNFEKQITARFRKSSSNMFST